MDVVVEIAPGLRMIYLIQIPLSRMSERRMTDIVSESYCLDKVEIESESGSYSSCYP